jgi:hypothetical protein
MAYRYTLRQFFQGQLKDGRGVEFTRDNEHLIAELEDDRLDEAIAKGWVARYEVPDPPREIHKAKPRGGKD